MGKRKKGYKKSSLKYKRKQLTVDSTPQVVDIDQSTIQYRVLIDKLENYIEEAINGNAILFVGSGFSKGATNLKNEDLKSGVELAKYFCHRCNLDEDMNLNDIAEIFLETYGKDEIIEELTKEFTVKNISSSHSIISEINWKRIYTTNYDNIIETSYAKQSKTIVSVTLNDNVYDVPKRIYLCIHLNGFVGRLDKNTLSKEFKLTNTSYLTSEFINSKWI